MRRRGPLTEIPELDARAAPERLEAAFRVGDLAAVRTHRNVHCPLYDRCLDHVVAADWTNFSCRSCALFTFLPAGDARGSLDAPQEVTCLASPRRS